MTDTTKTITYRAKGNAYVYSVINDIPADKSCVGLTVKSLCWGDGIIVAYKNAKAIDILFLDSGNVETVQKAALEVGNICDKVHRDYLNAKKKDEAIIEACKKHQKKISNNIRKAGKRITSRNFNRKARLEKALELYKDIIGKGGLNDNKIQESTST